MSQWHNDKRDWIIYLLTKGENKYVGITSKTMHERLARHKKTARKPETNNLLHNKMVASGFSGWRMKQLARVQGNYHEARLAERKYIHLSNLNETLNPQLLN